MKLFLIASLVLLSTVCLSQNSCFSELTPPLHLTFGMSEQSFRTQMKQYSKFFAYSFPANEEKMSGISYFKIPIGDKTATLLNAHFFENKLEEVSLFFEDYPSNFFVDILTEKYGKPALNFPIGNGIGIDWRCNRKLISFGSSTDNDSRTKTSIRYIDLSISQSSQQYKQDVLKKNKSKNKSEF